jgi:SAM-dependent methyltransferase
MLTSPMGALLRFVNRLLAPAGCLLVRPPRSQVLPPDLPDADLYTGPEDYARLFRPWRSKEWDAALRPEILANTLLSRQKLYFLHEMLRFALPAEGDIFEAGAGSGGSTRLMLDLLKAERSQRIIWSLDTFSGYEKIDPARDGTHLRLHDCRCASFEDVQRLVGDPQVRLIRGLIPATLAEVKADRIAFAHIDVNLSEPTADSTEFALSRLSPGGVIVFDDYAWPATFGARRAIDDVCRRYNVRPVVLPESTQAFLIRSRPS